MSMIRKDPDIVIKEINESFQNAKSLAKVNGMNAQRCLLQNKSVSGSILAIGRGSLRK